jgi:hypothetical protein
MTLRRRWRYEIHRKDVGRDSLVASGGVGSAAEVADIAKENPQIESWLLSMKPRMSARSSQRSMLSGYSPNLATPQRLVEALLLRLQPDLNQAAAGLVGVLHRLTSNAGSFVAGSQEDPAAVAAVDAARDFARWPDRPEPSPVACGSSQVLLGRQSPAMCLLS